MHWENQRYSQHTGRSHFWLWKHDAMCFQSLLVMLVLQVRDRDERMCNYCIMPYLHSCQHTPTYRSTTHLPVSMLPHTAVSQTFLLPCSHIQQSGRPFCHHATTYSSLTDLPVTIHPHTAVSQTFLLSCNHIQQSDRPSCYHATTYSSLTDLSVTMQPHTAV